MAHLWASVSPFVSSLKPPKEHLPRVLDVLLDLDCKMRSARELSVLLLGREQ